MDDDDDDISDGVSTFLVQNSVESLPEGSPINHDSYQFEVRIKKCSIRRINGPEGMRHTHYSEVRLHSIIPFSVTQAEALSRDFFGDIVIAIGESQLAMIRSFLVMFTTRLRLGTRLIGVIEILRTDIRTSWRYDGQSIEVNKLELVRYKGGGVDGDDELAGRTTTCCCICLEEFEEDMLVVRTRCSHYFHEKCITPWMDRNTTCPMCRSEVI